VSDNPRENDFERESSRLNEGLKSCRAVVDNYRSMMSDHGQDGTDLSKYVSSTSAAEDSFEADSGVN
jgi:hypothetical protein